MANHSSILACKFHGRRSLVGYSPWGLKESGTTEHTVATCRQRPGMLRTSFIPQDSPHDKELSGAKGQRC